MISLPSTILATMRAAAENLMTDTCTIEVQADAVGEMGEVLSDQYTTVATGVACRVITVNSGYGQARIVGGREVITEGYRLVVPYGTALAVDQRVTLDSDDSVWQVTDLVTERTSEVDAQAVIVRVL